MVASSAALLLVAAGFISYEMLTRRQNMTHDLSTLAEVIGNESTAAVEVGDEDRAKEILSALSAKKHIVAAALYNETGHLVAGYHGASSPGETFPKFPQRDGSQFTESDLTIFHEIHNPKTKEHEKLGTLYLKSDLEEMKQRLASLGTMVVMILLASSVITFFLSGILQRIISRPIFHLAKTARAVSTEKNYSVRATKHGNDELGQLIDGFNEMLGQIQERDAALLGSNEELEKRVSERTQD